MILVYIFLRTNSISVALHSVLECRSPRQNGHNARAYPAVSVFVTGARNIRIIILRRVPNVPNPPVFDPRYRWQQSGIFVLGLIAELITSVK